MPLSRRPNEPPGTGRRQLASRNYLHACIIPVRARRSKRYLSYTRYTRVCIMTKEQGQELRQRYERTHAENHGTHSRNTPAARLFSDAATSTTTTVAAPTAIPLQYTSRSKDHRYLPNSCSLGAITPPIYTGFYLRTVQHVARVWESIRCGSMTWPCLPSAFEGGGAGGGHGWG